MPTDGYRLDPSRFPKRLDLELSEPAMVALECLSARTGRSMSDLAADLLSMAIADEQDLCSDAPR